jgi:hypothetical protein
MSPSTGAVGATVTIAGTNFSTTLASNTVKFNGIQATITAATATSITVDVPSGATTGTVSVTTAAGTATSAGSFTVSMYTAAQFAGSCTLDPGTTDGIGTLASFTSPSYITTDGANLFVNDRATHHVRKIVIATGQVTTLQALPQSGLTTDGTNLYFFSGGGVAKYAIATGAFSYVSSSAPDGRGSMTTDGTNLYFTDYNNNTIGKVVISTGVTTTLAGRFINGPGGGYADGTGTAALFQNPEGITTDGTYLYVADNGNARIRKIVIATGVVTTLAGSGYGSSRVDDIGTAASFGSVTGITTDGTNLYVMDFPTIRKIVISTGKVTTLAQTGSQFLGYIFSGGVNSDITMRGSDLYFTDPANNVIRKASSLGSGASLSNCSPPTITRVSPSTGGPSTVVTITGTNFSVNTLFDVVQFNGTGSRLGVTSATNTTLTLTGLGSGAAAGTTGSVSVITGAGTATLAGAFTVTPPPPPASGGTCSVAPIYDGPIDPQFDPFCRIVQFDKACGGSQIEITTDCSILSSSAPNFDCSKYCP